LSAHRVASLPFAALACSRLKGQQGRAKGVEIPALLWYAGESHRDKSKVGPNRWTGPQRYGGEMNVALYISPKQAQVYENQSCFWVFLALFRGLFQLFLHIPNKLLDYLRQRALAE
jgi:hypothetical protein